MNQQPDEIPCKDAYGRPMLAKRVTGVYGEKYWIDALDLERPRKLITLLVKQRGQFVRVVPTPPEVPAPLDRN